MPVVSNREYRIISNLQVRSLEEGGENQYIVEGYASTYEKPYILYEDGDYEFKEVISSGAFDECDFDDLIMQFDHTGKVLARTKNETLKATVDDKGLFIRADLSKSKASKELYEEIAAGLIDKMSFSFVVAEENYTNLSDTKQLRRIEKIKKVYDVSAVSIPANNDTSIYTRCKGFEGFIEAHQKEFLRRQRALLKSKILKGNLQYDTSRN